MSLLHFLSKNTQKTQKLSFLAFFVEIVDYPVDSLDIRY